MRLSWLALLAVTFGCKGDSVHIGDSAPTGADSSAPLDNDGDGVPAGEDCDDNDAAVFPGAAELCDTLDNDCDGDTDEEVTSTFYADGDADGYGVEDGAVSACEAPEGYAAFSGDCDDADARFNPGAEESDCADPNDYNCDGSVGYADNDADGFAACEECDDGVAAVNPDADELCDGVDNDCDGLIDPGEALDATSYYADTDGDGFGDADYLQRACAQPQGYVLSLTDCDDRDVAVNPDADEVCDGVDNDCDGVTDPDDALDVNTYYSDLDGDGFGDPAAPTQACALPAGASADDLDCDDGEGAVNPDADEVCDGVDNDCDGRIDPDDALDAETWYADGDEDGYGDADVTTVACEAPSGFLDDDQDCDDGLADVNPAGFELCNGLDDDCDGVTDPDTAADVATWYNDGDGDGYGDPAITSLACAAPTGTVADATDCDDGDVGAYPGATETCDSVDNDCDGTVDVGTGALTFDGAGDYLRMKDNSALDIGTSDFTVELWVYQTNSTSSRLYSKGSFGYSVGYMLRTSGNVLLAEMASPAGTGVQCTGTTPLNDGKWHHVAAVFDRDANVTTYVDGKLEKACSISSFSGRSLNNSNNPTLGIYDADLASEPFKGKLDDARVWSTARSQAELVASMCDPLTGAESGLVGYWPLESDTKDKTSNASDGTLGGSAALTTR
ncbi:MAG: hypothetical protein IPN01_00855 [Deltaproteobacteria bacterium]|nr:hypothetical protein [Deltaproteobacteria bacterium]